MDRRGERNRHRHRSRSDDKEEQWRYRHYRREEDDQDKDSRRNYPDGEPEERQQEQNEKRRDEVRNRRRSRSPVDKSLSSRNRERSPDLRNGLEQPSKARRSRESESRLLKEDSDKQVIIKKSRPLPSQAESFSMTKDSYTALVRTGEEDKPLQEKQKPNFAPTGLLAAASNAMAQADGTSVTLKYHEPAEARKPPSKDQWKLFVFKGSDILETIELSLRSCWLVGREVAVVDLPAEHPSISKQHAVIQFRWIEKKNEFGDKLGRVKPYLIDLESANGTRLNKELIPSSRYLELCDKDMIQFGDSTREYVLMLAPKD